MTPPVVDYSAKGLDTREQLLEFHEKHYHAANMALVVLGKEDLDHLEGWARECFKEASGLMSQPPHDTTRHTRPLEAMHFQSTSIFPQ